MDINVDDLQFILTRAYQWAASDVEGIEKEEVEILRRVAEHVEVDPIEVTPRPFAKEYRHAYKSFKFSRSDGSVGDICRYCDGLENSIQHRSAMQYV